MRASELIQVPNKELVASWGLKPAVAEAIVGDKSDVLAVADRVEHEGIGVVTVTNPKYPVRLRYALDSAAPPVLFLKGNHSLLDERSVALIGSRDALGAGLDLARGIASALANERINVVSGYASGIDSASHEGALKAGGTTTFVLAEGILAGRKNEPIEPIVSESNSVFVSEFWPTAPWTKYQAMQRNATIIGLSTAIVVVESGREGGTFEAGKTALALGTPVFAVEWPDPPESAAGNAWFKSHGAEMLSPASVEQAVKLILAAKGRERPVSDDSLFE